MNTDSIIIRCKNCGAKNRIPKIRLNDRPVCGRCHSRLPEGRVSDSPVIVSDKTFNDEIISSPLPVLLDCWAPWCGPCRTIGPIIDQFCWAPWCGPCRTIGPIIDQLAKEFAGKVKFAKLNVDENPATSTKYNIMSIPTMLLFKDGKVVNSLVGALPKAEIENHLRSLI
ncbi:MAG: thioredoxin [Deltaproteobacteria bacterium]|nr:thioredoxin [Deltaproteobacteria bacterium]